MSKVYKRPRVAYTGPTIKCHACGGAGHDAARLRASQELRHAETNAEILKSLRCGVCWGRGHLKPNGTRIDR